MTAIQSIFKFRVQLFTFFILSEVLISCGTAVVVPRSFNFQPIVSQQQGNMKASLGLSTETEIPLIYDTTVPKTRIETGWNSVGSRGFIRMDSRIDYAFTDDFELYYNIGTQAITSYAGMRVEFHPTDNICKHLALDLIVSPELSSSNESSNILSDVTAKSEIRSSLLGGGVTLGWDIDPKRIFYTTIAYVQYNNKVQVKQSGALIDQFSFNDIGNQIMITPGLRIQDGNFGFNFELGYNNIQWERHDSVKKEASAAFVLDTEFH